MTHPSPSDFTPGDGWREVPWQEAITPPFRETLVLHAEGAVTARRWVREEPVPPLPTEIATLDGDDLIFVSDVLRALGKWKQGRS